MFRYSAGKKQIKTPFTAVYLDFDEVINRSGEADKMGFIGGTLIAGQVLAEVNRFCKKHNIPVYIITNRAANAKNLQHIEDSIKQVGDFAKENEVGGFKKTYIHFLGIEHCKRRGHSSLMGVHRTKLQEIQAIHQKELNFLKKSAQLVVDDDASNLNPLTEAGFATYLAEKENDDHMQAVLDFVKARVEAFYDFSLDEYEKKFSETASRPTPSAKYTCRDALYLKSPVCEEKSAIRAVVTAPELRKFHL
jgi:hypothetical protein